MGVWVFYGHSKHPFMEAMPGGYAGVATPWLNPWTLYDSLHYLNLARQGYVADDPMSAAFAPLYPLLLAPWGADAEQAALAGFILSNLCLLAALILLHQLVAERWDAPTAMRAVLALAFFPSSAVGSAVYSESLFLMLTIASAVAAQRRSWLACAVCAGLAAATRNVGLLLAVGLAWQAFDQRRQGTLWPMGLAALAPLLVWWGVQQWIGWHLGGGVNLAEIQHDLYGRTWTWPWIPVIHDIRKALEGRAVPLFNVGLTLLGLALLLTHGRGLTRSEQVLLGGTLLANLVIARTEDYAMRVPSAARYAFGAYPMALLLALVSRERVPDARRDPRLALLWSVAILSYGGIYANLFGRKSFVV